MTDTRSTCSIEKFLTYRSRCINTQPCRTKGVDYVLCWLQQTLRGVHNPVIDAAIAFGRLHRLPVVVYHGLGRQYPHASDRFHQFILEASVSLENDVTARGLRFVRHVDTQNTLEKGLVYRLAERASMLVLDEQAAFVGRWQAQKVANRLDRLVVAVDGARLVPELALGTVFTTTPSFRAHHTELREIWSQEPTNLYVDRAPFADDLVVESTALTVLGRSLIKPLIQRCAIDHSVAPVQWCHGGRGAANHTLAWAASDVINRYASRRNNPACRGTSHLSPYLHFGVLSPAEVVGAIDDAKIPSRDKWKYLDELLTWREYFHHLASHASDPANYSNIPAYAQATLSAHASDTRERLYSMHALIHGETDDELWNAAQRQFVLDGWMHNNLRMYWGKRLIGWCKSPEQAWTAACYLNDRFSLDGRDPSTYGNLRWCFGASRPAKEISVYGTVPRKSDRALRSRPGMMDWVLQQNSRTMPTISVPEQLPMVPRPQASGVSD